MEKKKKRDKDRLETDDGADAQGLGSSPSRRQIKIHAKAMLNAALKEGTEQALHSAVSKDILSTVPGVLNRKLQTALQSYGVTIADLYHEDPWQLPGLRASGHDDMDAEDLEDEGDQLAADAAEITATEVIKAEAGQKRISSCFSSCISASVRGR